MKKRIFAWIMLIGFILLILNLLFIGFQWQLSLALYIVIFIYAMFTMNKRNDGGHDDDHNDVR